MARPIWSGSISFGLVNIPIKQSVAAEKSRLIEITDFVSLDDIDPMYYDQPYYVSPDERAAKAYRLLATAMEQAKKVGLGRFVMRSKEYLAAIRPINGTLCLETMRFSEEVLPADKALPAVSITWRFRPAS